MSWKCAAEAGSGWRMTDMKGWACHIAFDLLSLEQDKREAKCQVIQVTHPQTHAWLHTKAAGWGDECFIIKPKTHQPFGGWHILTVSLSFWYKIIVTGGTRSVCQPQDFHALFYECVFLLLGPCKAFGPPGKVWVVPGGGRSGGCRRLGAR